MRRLAWPVVLVGLLLCSGTALRVVAALRPGLWADEIFSLAMATGHSLEHPSAAADPTLGDFVEPKQAGSPRFFSRYTEHEEPPAGMSRVLRAVLLSDTSPPVYYLLLNYWSRAFGTGDSALRLFSVLWALLAIFLLWLLGRDVGGERVAWSACVLFAFSPAALFYSVEGRMYSLVWCLTILLAWLSLQLTRERSPAWQAPAWLIVGAVGLLTHYFFAFVWLACLAWLLFNRRDARLRIAALASITMLAVLPWYLQVPASLKRWRVTGSWMNGQLEFPKALENPFDLAATLVSATTYLGGSKRGNTLIVVVLVVLVVAIGLKGSVRGLFSNRALLLWGWLAAACFGPLAFDILRHTTTSEIPRYALLGLPAALLLLGLGMSQLPQGIHLVVGSVILLAWFPGSLATISEVSRPWQPYPVVAARVAQWARPDDLVLISSIPSGVIGFSRYLRPDIALASWVPHLHGREVPDDLESLLKGRRRVALVRIHEVGEEAPAEPWLRAHGRLLDTATYRRSSARVLFFGPVAGDSLFRPAGPLVQHATE